MVAKEGREKRNFGLVNEKGEEVGHLYRRSARDVQP